MFTGIIRYIGEVRSVKELGGTEQSGVEVVIFAPTLPLESVHIGDSIAVQGACMTVVEKTSDTFKIHVSKESLTKTVGLNTVGKKVNLETAMKVGETLDGHIVSGHVDAIGKITKLEKISESYELCVSVPASLSPFVAYKGSITINGISLTINRVKDDASGSDVSINIIPHTIAHTTLQYNQVGDAVNVEIDMLARYVVRYVECKR
ncbi:riboflavin synthase [Basilea psittacipulmonis]|uniref:Riboflavin synthase n=1 Tax=Basilea psittacipulmonis DSM 24701 TaxID=1072685 RepID=A0A077DHV6_9BURK|nr:riboflavin synthase [Basilea psittacipulmonis]AIL33122.1 riboflavin synthase subunit alpha [Basilea psittacipulmonis DSM 24701]